MKRKKLVARAKYKFQDQNISTLEALTDFFRLTKFDVGMKKVFSRNTGYLFEIFGSDFKKELKFKNTEKYEFESQTKTITMALSGALGLKKLPLQRPKSCFFNRKKLRRKESFSLGPGYNSSV